MVFFFAAAGEPVVICFFVPDGFATGSELAEGSWPCESVFPSSSKKEDHSKESLNSQYL